MSDCIYDTTSTEQGVAAAADGGDTMTTTTTVINRAPPPDAVYFMPYKYAVDANRGIFRIFSRSLCGNRRKTFSLGVKSWSYIDMGNGSLDPSRTVALLKDELSTDRVSYDWNLGSFIVEPSNMVTRRVREISKKIVRVELTTFSILSRFGQRFFDILHEDGRWAAAASVGGGGPPLAIAAADGDDDVGSGSGINGGGSGVSKWASSILRTVVFSAVDCRSVAFVRFGGGSGGGDDDGTTGGGGGTAAAPKVYIYTTYTSFANPTYTTAASASIMSSISSSSSSSAATIDIIVRTFASPQEIIEELVTMMRDQVDIVVHFGESDAATLSSGGGDGGPGPFAIALRRLQQQQSDLVSTVEIFNLRDYVENLYTDMPSHELADVINEVNIFSSTATTIDDMVAAASAATLGYGILGGCLPVGDCHHHGGGSGGGGRHGGSAGGGGGGGGGGVGGARAGGATPYLPSIGTTVHSAENIVFFLERIASRAFLISKLYSSLSKSMFDLTNMSGCNISSLTQREHTSRGVVAFIEPASAWSQIVDTLPSDYMESGIHGLTYVTPFASLLIESLCQSEHQLTALVGRRIAALRPYGWIIREIYSLRDLVPWKLRDFVGSFGLFRGMIYSSQMIPGHDVARQWSTLICASLSCSSWIGISVIAPPGATTSSSSPGGGGGASSSPDGSSCGGDDGSSSSSTAVANSQISFGYFGLEDVCRHPFDAIRIAVEMFLSLKICTNTTASPKTLASALSLTTENMAIHRRVTAANLATYASLLPQQDIMIIQSGEKEVTLQLWYKSIDRFTTNPLLADRRVYVQIIEAILVRAFGGLIPPNPTLPPPPNALPSPPPPPVAALSTSSSGASPPTATAVTVIPPPPPAPNVPTAASAFPSPPSSLSPPSLQPPPPPPPSSATGCSSDTTTLPPPPSTSLLPPPPLPPSSLHTTPAAPPHHRPAAQQQQQETVILTANDRVFPPFRAAVRPTTRFAAGGGVV
jgi:hypothetical protein